MCKQIFLNELCVYLLISSYSKFVFLRWNFSTLSNSQEKTDNPILAAVIMHCIKCLHDIVRLVCAHFNIKS